MFDRQGGAGGCGGPGYNRGSRRLVRCEPRWNPVAAARPPVGGTLTLNLDIDGFFLGPEFAAIMAALFTALFGGFANALIGNAFGSGV